MHSPPSPVQPKLCLTPTQTQLLSVITSISGCLSGVLNYKSCKTWIKLLEPLMGVEGAVTPSLRFNWPNFSKASGVASGLRFIGSVFVVSLSKYLLASSPTGQKRKASVVESSCLLKQHVHAGIQTSTLWSYGLSPHKLK